jgi:hypothetical protein
VALGQVFSEYFGFPCQSSFHRIILYPHNHPGQAHYNSKWPTYRVNPVWTPPPTISKFLKNTVYDVVHRRLQLHEYKLQIVQYIQPCVKPQRINCVTFMLEQFTALTVISGKFFSPTRPLSTHTHTHTRAGSVLHTATSVGFAAVKSQMP